MWCAIFPMANPMVVRFLLFFGGFQLNVSKPKTVSNENGIGNHGFSMFFLLIHKFSGMPIGGFPFFHVFASLVFPGGSNLRPSPCALSVKRNRTSMLCCHARIATSRGLGLWLMLSKEWLKPCKKN